MRLRDVVSRQCSRLRTSPTDVLLAVALTAMVLAELSERTARNPLLTGLLVAPAFLALAWRRAAPTTVATVVLVAGFVLAARAPGEFGPQLPFLAVLLVVYTCAATLRGRRAVLAGAVTLALVTAAHLVTADGDSGDFLPWLVWGAPWAAGRLVRRRTLEAAASATRAALLVQHAEEQQREAAARERDRIARELHDVVAHGVSLMVVQAGAERLRLGTQQERTREVLDAVETAGRTALAELRTMLAVLRIADPPDDAPGPDLRPDPDLRPPPDRQPQPDLHSLPTLVAQVRAAGVPVTLELPDGVSAGLPPGVALSAYRIVQEALTNVLKHAPGAPTDVVVRRDSGGLALRVSSALTAPASPSGRGRGLVGMAERAALHGGRVDAGPREGRWLVEAELPVLQLAPASS